MFKPARKIGTGFPWLSIYGELSLPETSNKTASEKKELGIPGTRPSAYPAPTRKLLAEVVNFSVEPPLAGRYFSVIKLCSNCACANKKLIGYRRVNTPPP